MPRCCLRGRNPSPRIVFIHTALIIAAPIITTSQSTLFPSAVFPPFVSPLCKVPIFSSPGVSNHKTFLFSNLHRSSFRLHHFPRRPNSGRSTFLAANKNLRAKAWTGKPIMHFQSSKVLIPIFLGNFCAALSGSAFEF